MELMYRQNGDLTKLLKSAWEKRCPRVPPVQSLFGQCPNREENILNVASLILPILLNTDLLPLSFRMFGKYLRIGDSLPIVETGSPKNRQKTHRQTEQIFCFVHQKRGVIKLHVETQTRKTCKLSQSLKHRINT